MPNPVEFLAWDSKFFNKRVGRLRLDLAATLGKSIQSAYQQRYELLYIYSSVPIKESLIGNYSLFDVGGHVTFVNNLGDHRLEEVEHMKEISQFQLDTPTPELLDLAFLSGHLSRFKTDSSLPSGSFERLYESWLVNTLNSRPKNKVYVYHRDNRVAGLITSENSGSKSTIGLLAVSQSCQGTGIATNLIKYMLRICSQNGALSIEVKTQLVNKSARALYTKNAFAERERSFLYHAHIVG